MVWALEETHRGGRAYGGLPSHFSMNFAELREKYSSLSVTHSDAPVWQADQADLSSEWQLGTSSRQFKNWQWLVMFCWQISILTRVAHMLDSYLLGKVQLGFFHPLRVLSSWKFSVHNKKGRTHLESGSPGLDTYTTSNSESILHYAVWSSFLDFSVLWFPHGWGWERSPYLKR